MRNKHTYTAAYVNKFNNLLHCSYTFYTLADAVAYTKQQLIPDPTALLCQIIRDIDTPQEIISREYTR